MKILRVDVDKTANKYNPYSLRLIVDRFPSTAYIIYMKKDNYIFGHNEEGIARYFYYLGPGDGNDGRRYKVKIYNGKGWYNQWLIGPYSSRASVINAIGGGPYIDVMLIRKRDSKQRPCSIKLDLIKDAIKNTDFTLQKQETGNEVLYTVS